MVTVFKRSVNIMLIKNVVWSYVISALFMLQPISAQTLAYKGVWYRPGDPSGLWASLSDDTGSYPTPRVEVLKSLDQNFSYISNTLHANAVVVTLNDDDSWAS